MSQKAQHLLLNYDSGQPLEGFEGYVRVVWNKLFIYYWDIMKTKCYIQSMAFAFKFFDRLWAWAENFLQMPHSHHSRFTLPCSKTIKNSCLNLFWRLPRKTDDNKTLFFSNRRRPIETRNSIKLNWHCPKSTSSGGADNSNVASRKNLLSGHEAGWYV